MAESREAVITPQDSSRRLGHGVTPSSGVVNEVFARLVLEMASEEEQKQ